MRVVSRAYARYIRVAPRKVHQVIDLIRGRKVPQALTTLASVNKRAKVYVEKALKSAISNAKQNPAIKIEELFVSKICADKGPMLKRYRAAAMGRATMIRRRTTHLSIELAREEKKELKRRPGRSK